jgi:hypothetical protein
VLNSAAWLITQVAGSSCPRYQEVQVRGPIARRQSGFDLCGSGLVAGSGRTKRWAAGPSGTGRHLSWH